MISKRIAWIDIAKGICILLVIFVHTWPSAEQIVNFSFAFFMQMFFYIDGIILAEKHNNGVSGLPFSTFLKRKFKTIIYPYLLFSAITVLLDYFVKDGVDTTTELIDSITFKGIGVLWFLPAMFLSVIFTELFFKSNICRLLKGAILVASAVIPLVLGNLIYANVTAVVGREPFLLKCAIVLLRGLVGFTFTISGYAVHGYYLRHMAGKFIQSRVLMGLIGFALMVLVFFTSQINSPSNMSGPITPNILLYYFNALTGCIGTALISIAIKNFILLEYCGLNSLIIMLTHLNLYLVEISTTLGLKLGAYIPIRGITHILIASVLALLIWVSVIVFKPLVKMISK